jgi:hypothetical protein
MTDKAEKCSIDHPLENWLPSECLEVFPRSVLRNTVDSILQQISDKVFVNN